DLVQETLLRALANIHSFQPGTNMPAWLFTILRNLFRSEYRKRRREVEDADGSYADTLKTHPEQTSHVEFKEFTAALNKLPEDQREALILIGASGFSYEEAAEICGCAVGTIKSRVNRARTRLANLLHIESVNDFGPDRATATATSAMPPKPRTAATSATIRKVIAQPSMMRTRDSAAHRTAFTLSPGPPQFGSRPGTGATEQVLHAWR